ncbi:hypothetical protein J6590_105840 [Homalodisca vitripennis]|nr:hypothetical protein J6590_105840 [Homalodisca vitripennis]
MRAIFFPHPPISRYDGQTSGRSAVLDRASFPLQQVGRTDTHNEGGQEHEFVATDGLVKRVDKVLRENHSFRDVFSSG